MTRHNSEGSSINGDNFIEITNQFHSKFKKVTDLVEAQTAAPIIGLDCAVFYVPTNTV